jgi:uncharacterized damage-inducible protein DinB
MENNVMEPAAKQTQSPFISTDALLDHWQGHRRLTRRVIEAFPEDKLFTYSVGGMRPFGELAIEMLHMAAPTLRGIVTNEWPTFEQVAKNFVKPTNRAELLALWDRSTEQMNSLWPHISTERFQEIVKAWGQWEGTVYWVILYLVDNEIHHRGQGYVYLRSLGIEPPYFWERN